ncbi:STAS domain-containing protein [Marinospirillum insulare]|uniref:Chemotaxis locus anti-sigma factor antagonist n=1 Tax=Marinospirillum insulare TaxID=217169 RepID=A0ABQ5ZZ17_9GAMM|nr:STAS domain-containing protein [Marinospirillum insulare]GLR64333.1 chemotaxis locus anti-sigma factor antagonist [Marinospirillum insulare]
MSNLSVVRIPERFDFSCHKKFNENTEQVLKNTQVKVISLDFSQVTYLDSAALGMVVYLHKKAAAANKKIEIINASGVALEILMVANINKLIEIK